MSPTRLTLNLLGEPTVGAKDGPFPLSPSALTLLAYLAISPLERRARTVVAAQLFADCPERLARRRLSTALWRLRSEVRHRVDIDLLDADHSHSVRFNGAVDLTIDSTVFTGLVSTVMRRPPESIASADAERLEQALALRRGALVESCEDEWVLAERNRIENLYLDALDYLVQFYGRHTRVEDIRRCAELALTLEPLREDIHRHVMAAYANAGRLDLVERQFEQCRTTLLAELGVDPLPETVVLYSRLTRGTPGDAVASAMSITSLIHELEQAQREVGRLDSIVSRALGHLHRLK